MHKLSLWFQGQPLGLSHDAGSAESPCEVSRDRSGVELPAESSAGRTFFELCHTCQGCGTKNKTAFPFGSADLRNVSTFSSCVHKSPQSIPDWSCRIHQPSQETVSCAKPAVCTSSNEPVAALPVEQEGYLEAADARMMNLEEDEVSGGEDDDESSGEELQRGGAEVDIDRDDEDNGEDVMIVDLRAERLQRMCMHCSRHAREVQVLPCNHYNLCRACVQCSYFWRSHFHSEGNAPFCLQCNQHIDAMVYQPLVYGHMRRVLRCRCGTMRRGG
ncbi:uncharacterized protein LOC112565593 isoform X1 [Pomacea canaliculata]|uniref:uncharacterized protein LOC112565593 isoform X1 n=1 Tax=Pomacea canaliculata TaxID=400727 RepID=UPI000D73BF1F|nr:uncharacterized protein LOC112565593 isoform X1 [Pomacea canaliculata]